MFAPNFEGKDKELRRDVKYLSRCLQRILHRSFDQDDIFLQRVVPFISNTGIKIFSFKLILFRNLRIGGITFYGLGGENRCSTMMFQIFKG